MSNFEGEALILVDQKKNKCKKAELLKQYVMSLKKVVCKDREGRNGMQQ